MNTVKKISLLSLLFSIITAITFLSGCDSAQKKAKEIGLQIDSIQKTAAGVIFPVDSVTPSTNQLYLEPWAAAIRYKFGVHLYCYKSDRQMLKMRQQRNDIDTTNKNHFHEFPHRPSYPYTLAEYKKEKTTGRPFIDNSFVTALDMAYREHRPLAISPDMIWLLIVNGFANHIHYHKGKYSILKTAHKGGKSIRIKLFPRWHDKNGVWKLNWYRVVDKLTHKTGKYIQRGLRSLLVPKFSTTQPRHILAYQTVLLDLLQPHFNYFGEPVCGIPYIRLLGKASDWQNIINRVKKLRKFGLDDWLKRLLPVLRAIMETAKGNHNKKFWQQIYSMQSSCKDERGISGWAMWLFPYIHKHSVVSTYKNKDLQINHKYNLAPNPYLKKFPKNLKRLEPSVFPPCLARINFTLLTKPPTRVRILSGFVGISSDRKNGALRPEIGWVVKRR